MPKNIGEKGLVPILLLVVVLALGGAAAYFYYQNNSTPSQVTQSQNNTNVASVPLSIESPTEGTLIKDNKVLVKGKTKANTTVVFYTEMDENSVESDASGTFQGEIGLGEGINTLTVVAYGEDGQETATTVDIVNDNAE